MRKTISRRHFIAGLGATAVAAPSVLSATDVVSGFSRAQSSTSTMRVGYAAITWGGNDEVAIREIAEAGFSAVQLRTAAVDKFGKAPGELKDLLAKNKVTMPVLSSGNLGIDPSNEASELALHISHAKFLRDIGGQYLQIIDERPKGRPIVAADYVRLGQLLTQLGKRTADLGVTVVYHHHMNSLGEKPSEVDAVLDATDPKVVNVLFDIAHYAQGGGDPVATIRRYRDRIKVVHLKDVRAIDRAPGYEFVELGRGRVDVKGSVAALKDVGFRGWAIVELDRVPDANGSPKASAIFNREYLQQQLGLHV
jgi:inosose dehydratase